MTNKEVYKIWAPEGKKWIDWVRPVPFINIGKYQINELIDYNLPSINYLNIDYSQMAIILDLDVVDSVKEGISLAKMGFIPIPIFNGTDEMNGSISTTNNRIVSHMLEYGATLLKEIDVKDINPVFLLDNNRLQRYRSSNSVFDNSWDIYHQDLPTYKYFLSSNINKILVRGNKINDDLGRILYNYQKHGIEIFISNGYDVNKVKVKKQKEKD